MTCARPRTTSLLWSTGITRLPDLPLSLRLVRELHAKLMAGVRGETATPGEFRKSPELDRASWLHS